MNKSYGFLVALLAVAAIPTATAASAGSFVNFESGQMRPLTLSPNRATLFALNTPDNRVAVYTVKPAAPFLVLAAEFPVGLEPVAIAARSDTEVWIVNNVSDSISIATRDSIASSVWTVTRTLLTCDEPRDIVFASGLAFITAARRGPACPVAAVSGTAGAGRGVVQVFDPTQLGTTLSGTPKATIVVPGDITRPLAADLSGNLVYAGVFLSGNRTTTVAERFVTMGGGLPAAKVAGSPYTTPGSFPRAGLIVKRVVSGTTVRWEDEDHRDWSSAVGLDLPDTDVVQISSLDLKIKKEYSGVGTVLLNMAVRPGTGAVYVSEIEARNEVRFEPILEGHFAESRVTRISNPNAATPLTESIHLNQHINYAALTLPAPASERDCSIGLPGALIFNAAGDRMYLAAFGSGKVALYKDLASLTSIKCGSSSRRLIDVAAGPSGLAYDDFLRRLYVLSRLEPSITVINQADNLAGATVAKVVKLPFDPSPAEVVKGRKFLYDTRNSGHGDSSCATCHIFGDFDGLAWDLGNPLGPNGFFHPMKGPMTTQTLRGMKGAGPMHWRGDRSGPTDRDSFAQFNGAIESLLGGTKLSSADMFAYADFALTIAYPPSPHRGLDNSLDADQIVGKDFFDNQFTLGGFLKCSDTTFIRCHVNPLGTDGNIITIEGPQPMKVPHLRNLYQKVGMFASSPPKPQVRGFGNIHDGSTPGLFDFLGVFDGLDTDTKKKQVEAYILGFDTGLKPAVGQQVTLTASNVAQADVVARLDLLIAQASVPGTCDLIAKGLKSGQQRGWFLEAGTFKSDKAGESATTADLKALALTSPVTFTCVPPGSGARIGIDRDGDTLLDRDDPNPVGP